MAATSSATAMQGSAARGWIGFLLVTLSLIVEGFDLQAANFAAPSILADFHAAKAQAGPLQSASLFGVLFGAIFLAPLGDRYGRRALIIRCCAAYGVISLVSAAATDLTQLVLLRFLIGIGLGAVLPNALALAGEFAPEKLLAAAAGLVGIGITLGGTLAGATAAMLLPGYGWQGVFFAAGVLPLAIALLLWFTLPESPAFLRGEVPEKSGSVVLLLTPAERSKTIAIWLSFMLVLMVAYLLTGWVPLVIKDQGYSTQTATWLATAAHGGGVFGGVVCSLFLARKQWPVVAVFAATAAVVMLLLAMRPWDIGMLTALLILQGFFSVGTQNGLNGSAGAAYSPSMRTLGLGWALGLGRVGSILGPLAGSVAVLIGLGAPRHFFYLPVLPLLIAALLAVYLSRHGRPKESQS